jgi:hypothetical protein
MGIKKFKTSSISSGYKRSSSWDINSYVFPKTSEMMSWFDASDPETIVLNGSNVLTWKDKGNVRFDLTNTVSGCQPAFVQNGLNGRSIITFDGTDDFLINASGAVAYDRPFGTFAVIRPNVSISGYSAIVFSGSNQGIAGASDAHFYFIEGGRHAYWTGQRSIHAMTTLPSQNVWHLVYTGMTAGGILTIRVNQINQSLAYSGVTVYDNLDTADTAPISRKYNNPVVGKHPAPNNASFFNGSVAEILNFNKAMTSQEILDVENYLKAKWGV